MQEPAANLSGGQQQMLTLSMALLSQPAPADDRRALARPRTERGGRAPRGGAAAQGAGHHRDPGGAVGERGADRRRDGVLHGEGRDPLPRPHQRAARAPRCAPLGVPRGGGVGGARRRCPRRRARRRRAARRRHRALRSAATAPTARGDVRVRVRGVSKHFGGIAALDDVSFDVYGPARCSGSSARTARARPRSST